jgi:hypothetical protein
MGANRLVLFGVGVGLALLLACSTPGRKRQSDSAECGDHVCQFVLAGWEWATDHHGYLPNDLFCLTNEVLPCLLLCPGDHSRLPPRDWASFASDSGLCTYEIVGRGLRIGETNQVFVRCRLHPDHFGYADGTVFEGARLRRVSDTDSAAWLLHTINDVDALRGGNAEPGGASNAAPPHR